ncbi:MAG: hypothetical protein CK427_08420 [Leptospira sp.]|nr:MAG: hypothetical protein CK427_08420 [Leptospira sp.]
MLQNEYFLIAIAILPGLIYVSIYYNLDKHKKEPSALILKAFFWGAALLIPIGIFQTYIPDKGFSESFLLQLLYMILILGLSEELGKWLVTRFFSFRNFNFEELTDGLVYGASAGAMFAVCENIFYVLENGYETAIFRAVLSVPGHIFLGSISGYWLGKFKFQNIAVMSTSPRLKKILKDALTLAAFCLLLGIIFMILIFTSELGDSGHSSNVLILFYLGFFAFFFFKLGRLPKISIIENRSVS